MASYNFILVVPPPSPPEAILLKKLLIPSIQHLAITELQSILQCSPNMFYVYFNSLSAGVCFHLQREIIHIFQAT